MVNLLLCIPEGVQGAFILGNKPFGLEWDIVEVDRFVADVFDNVIFFLGRLRTESGSLGWSGFSAAAAFAGTAAVEERYVISQHFHLAALLAFLLPRAALQPALDERPAALGQILADPFGQRPPTDTIYVVGGFLLFAVLALVGAVKRQAKTEIGRAHV